MNRDITSLTPDVEVPHLLELCSTLSTIDFTYITGSCCQSKCLSLLNKLHEVAFYIFRQHLIMPDFNFILCSPEVGSFLELSSGRFVRDTSIGLDFPSRINLLGNPCYQGVLCNHWQVYTTAALTNYFVVGANPHNIDLVNEGNINMIRFNLTNFMI